MPSGFQQDQNQLSPSFYRVVWSANTGTYPSSNGTTDLNTNGSISPNSSDSFSYANRPTTLAYGKARARANMRFRNVVNRLTGLADCQILDIEVTEANADAQVTDLAFTVRFDRDAGLVGATLAQIGEAGNNAVDGSTDITSANTQQNREWCIKDQFVRGFIAATSANARVYNGSTGTDNMLPITVAAPDTAADIWADTTVTLIDGTETISIA